MQRGKTILLYHHHLSRRWYDISRPLRARKLVSTHPRLAGEDTAYQIFYVGDLRNDNDIGSKAASLRQFPGFLEIFYT